MHDRMENSITNNYAIAAIAREDIAVPTIFCLNLSHLGRGHFLALGLLGIPLLLQQEPPIRGVGRINRPRGGDARLVLSPPSTNCW